MSPAQCIGVDSGTIRSKDSGGTPARALSATKLPSEEIKQSGKRIQRERRATPAARVVKRNESEEET